MDKKQQIEEMATELSRTNEKNSLGLRESEIDLFSSDLYAAGYRKIDGDNYVSREWHDEQVLHLESELERLKSEKENIERNCAVITKVELKEYKRQAVKEFAERLKKSPRINNYGLEFVALVDIDAELKALLKEYEK